MNYNDIVNDELNKDDCLLQTPDEEVKQTNVYASLIIPIDKISKENVQKILSAIKLLHEAGVYFDSGCGCGFIDMQLDWSLKNAYLIKSYRQPKPELSKEDFEILYAYHSGISVEKLYRMGLKARPCNCNEKEWCKGWQMISDENWEIWKSVHGDPGYE